MTTDLSPVRLLDAAAAVAATHPLRDCYQAVFCAPPWHEPPHRADEFPAALRRHAGQTGFVGALAEDADAEVIGFAYGFGTPDPFPTTGSYGTVRELLGPGTDQLVGRREVRELAVRPDARHRGLGRALLGAVTDVPSWLLTVTAITTATGFYERLGWRPLVTGAGLTVYLSPPRG